MDLTEMKDLLVIDLKMVLDTDISTDEATRAINKAVDELSRHIPRERIYEHTWIEAVTDDSFTTPYDEDDDKIVDAAGLVDTVDGDTLTLTTIWLDVPRPVLITLTDANDSILRMTVVVKGTDGDGMYREERFYRHGGKVQTGKINFLFIYEVEVSEIFGSDTNDILDVGTAEPDLATGGIWVQLGYPVEPGSESIYSGESKAGILYVRGTDYEMDYANGRIRLISGGSMATGATGTKYYANYNKAQCHIDISPIIPDLIRITKVIYPVNKIPEQSVAFTVWENMLTIGSPRPTVSQEALVDKEHIAIYYEARQTPPTDFGSGSYPELLDEVVILGATGHALLMEAIQYELQAVTDLGEMRTTLGYLGIGVVNSTPGTLVYKAIDDALDKVGLYLETYSGNGSDNARAILEAITDDIETLRNAIHKDDTPDTGALFKMLTYLDEVDTTDLQGAGGHIGSASLLINRLNDGGPDVSSKYAELGRTFTQMAQMRIQAAMGYAQEAQIRLSNLRSYIEEAGGWMRMGEDFIAEAQARISEANVYLAEAQRYQDAVGLDLVLADRFRVEAQSRLNEFRTILSSKAEYRKRVVSASVRQPG